MLDKTPSQRSATAGLVDFTLALEWDRLPPEVRQGAKRHLLDTVGAIIAGSAGDVAQRTEAMLVQLAKRGCVPVPGMARRADLLDAALLAGTAGHGLEVDDGHRQGAVHPGVCVVPAALFAAYKAKASGRALLEAVSAGYEVLISIAIAAHPALRKRGFHATSAVGPFGAAAAAGRLLGLGPRELANAFGLAASCSGGLFAFINGGSDVKRLHAGLGARDGLQSALLAQVGLQGPPDVLEARDGFLQAFAYGRGEAPKAIRLPSLEAGFNMPDCYVKPHACCRHLQPAAEALMRLMDEEGLSYEDVRDVRVQTYAISAEHAHTGWDEFGSAQLSFPYVMALAMRHRAIRLEHFEEGVRADPDVNRLCGLVRVEADPEMDRGYPDKRPARVTVATDRGEFVRASEEALGCRDMPIDDRLLGEKFIALVAPRLGEDRAQELLQDFWTLEEMPDVSPLVERLARAA